LSAICRRSALIADITPAALHSHYTSLRRTPLLDELEVGATLRDRDLSRLLRAGSTQGQKVLRTRKAYDLFGPKVIVSRQEPSDAALASRALVIAMPPSTRELPLDEPVLDGIADQFQSRFLPFRLRNYKHARPSEVGKSGLTLRMKDMARALTIPLLGEAELESAVIDLLRPHDVEAKRRRNGAAEWAVATALYKCCHPAPNLLTVGQLSSEVDDVLALQGETYHLTPRKIGDILRSLGIETERLGNRGRGLWFSQTVLA
jgi:hypothetical protein